MSSSRWTTSILTALAYRYVSDHDDVLAEMNRVLPVEETSEADRRVLDKLETATRVHSVAPDQALRLTTAFTATRQPALHQKLGRMSRMTCRPRTPA